MPVPFVDLDAGTTAISCELRSAFDDVLRSKCFVLGPHLASFESEYAVHSEVQHSIGVASGASALELALEVLDIGPGDEVIVPSHTFIATVLAVSNRGAKPVLVEPLQSTQNLDPALVEMAISPQTRAIMCATSPQRARARACTTLKARAFLTGLVSPQCSPHAQAGAHVWAVLRHAGTRADRHTTWSAHH